MLRCLKLERASLIGVRQDLDRDLFDDRIKPGAKRRITADVLAKIPEGYGGYRLETQQIRPEFLVGGT